MRDLTSASDGIQRADMFCDFRAYRECGCDAGTCQQYPTPVPVIAATKPDLLRVIGFGLVVTLVSYWALSQADARFHQQFLDQQEATVHVYRR